MENILARKLHFISSFFKKFFPIKSDCSQAENKIDYDDPDTAYPDNWIMKLDVNMQSRLAIKLVNIVMSEYDNLAGNNALEYNDSISGKYFEIAGFLHNAILEIKNNASIIVLHDSIKYSHIKKCLDEFVPMVIAMNDGEWVVPYLIKKIILAVFNIIMGLEHINLQSKKDYFSKSISLSIELIESRRLLSMNRMHLLLEEYKVHLS